MAVFPLIRNSQATDVRFENRVSSATVLAMLCAFWASPTLAPAYVGPGAGMALGSSFGFLFAALAGVLFVFFTLPFRGIVQWYRTRRIKGEIRVKRVIVLGLDGQDPDITQEFLDEGILPNFAKLRDQGCFTKLGTTLLAESPVAWSSFQTGSNPGRHKIFDFLVPNRKTYLPELSSAKVEPSTRSISIGPIKIPIGKPVIQLGRKSIPFWKILGHHGVFSTVLRVPITFPPEKFNGISLSAMGAPDLKGSQGTYFYYSSVPDEGLSLTSGIRIPVEVSGGVMKSDLLGPELSPEQGETKTPFEVRLGGTDNGKSGDATLTIGKDSYPLTVGEYTPWVPIDFKIGLMTSVRGIGRFFLIETEPHFKLYLTPINIDPENPVLPISHPGQYAIYLAKTLGPFATLGVAEDTSSLNEEVIGEAAFLKQSYDIHEERERMFFDAIEKTSRGMVCCVFDATDRIQHMFYRHRDADHPANRGRDNETHKNAIRDLYIRMDDLVGRTMEKLDDDTVLFVMSDHGFKPFKYCVNLNTWLYENGFLALKDGAGIDGDMFHNVDWSKTKAYAVGFGGIYLNMARREAQGIVKKGEEAEQVKREIAAGLSELYDEERKVNAVRKVYDTQVVYAGPYVADAPDLIVGFRLGYRVAWSSVTGGLSESVIEDNTRYWSGDHNFNPPDVPGMLFCNRNITAENPRIIDIGPTVLDLFGIEIPSYCDGRSIMPAEPVSESMSAPEEIEEGEKPEETEEPVAAES